MAGGFILNILAGTSQVKLELERIKIKGELPHVKSILSAHPGKDIERGRDTLSDGALYVYPSGSRIVQSAGRGRVVDMQTGVAITYCVSMRSANNEDAIKKVGENTYQLVSNLSGFRIPTVDDGKTKTILGELAIDPDTRELYQDGFYFYSIRVLTNIKIQKEN